jgi:serine/threonine protein kinase
VRSRASLPAGYTDPVRLGTGAWGQVWRVHQTALDRDVALKIQKGTASLAEARRLASLRSAILPEIFDAFLWRGHTCLTMEWLQGVSLDRLLQAGPLPEPSVWFLVQEIAQGLADLHDQGLAHGDLKPANVMVLRDGALRLLDLGFSGSTKAASLHQGTPAYLPPEALQADCSPVARDLWALGILTSELLLGRRPNVGKDSSNLLSHLAGNPSLHPLWIPLLLGALEPEPRRRWETARDWLARLDGFSEISPKSIQSELARLVDPLFRQDMALACVQAGREQLEARRPTTAYRIVTEALEWDPDHWQALELLGKIDLGKARPRRWPWLVAAIGSLIAGTLGFLLGSHRPKLAPPLSRPPEIAPELLASRPSNQYRSVSGPGFFEGSAPRLPAAVVLPPPPPGASLWVDGEQKRSDAHGKLALDAGRHLLQWRQGDSIRWQQRIKISAWQVMNLHPTGSKP